jgi:hypothetical protein
MKKPILSKQVRFDLYLTDTQSQQISRLRAAGLSASTIARQALRKCHDMELEPEDDHPRPVRFNPYLSSEDAAILIEVATRIGCPRSETLRSLISTYLSVNEAAINALF